MNDEIVLEPGEEICDKCYGEGVRTIQVQVGFKIEFRRAYCSKCNGTKKIDWIQKVTGNHKIKKGFPIDNAWNGEMIWGYSGLTEKESKIYDANCKESEQIDKEEYDKVFNKIVENLCR